VSGASGYVLKSAVDRDLVESCRSAMRGEPFLYPGGVRALMGEYLDRARNGETVDGDVLTPREEEILGMSDRVELTRYAIRRGLVQA
jgi:DNA-binding NarL/FixJ family response regulator